MEKQKGKIKSLAKRAKGRLSNGFWSEYRENLEESPDDDRRQSNKSEILNYYRIKAARELKDDEDEKFYEKVKSILDNYGDVSDIIGRLCDKEKIDQLGFEAMERYVFEICNKYLECRERYEKEKQYEVMIRRQKEIGKMPA